MDWNKFVEEYNSKRGNYISLTELNASGEEFIITGARLIRDRFEDEDETLLEFDIILTETGEERKLTCKPDASQKRLMLVDWVLNHGSTGKGRVVKRGKSFDFKWVE
jgi:hypothetical protein